MTTLARAEQNLILRCSDPLNAETPPDKLIASFLTPQADFYIRSHGPTPELADDHPVTLDGFIDHPRSYTVAELQAAFQSRTVVATMQCAGNRRAHLQGVGKTSGDPWDVGAIGNAEWTGVALRDVLAAAGIQDGALYVGTIGADDVDVDGETAPFGASIPIAKALEPDVLIAWAMNGKPLAPEHGAPLRLVVPGYAGVRSAKWLTRIEVRDCPSDAPIQAKDYKLFPSSVTKDEADWDQGLTIEEMPLNASICSPVDGAHVDAGACGIAGYAVAFGRAVSRVDVSVNGGTDWEQAELTVNPDAPWSWTQWRVTAGLSPGLHVLVVRAVDGAGQMQPERPEAIWNFAGYLSTAWHRITVTAR
ncbi:molybdopterin-dependent oxidoreductase [Sphingomonas nostoxanthinifaciens]|uniref:molybdopterin-dependent oxidoreductase n=1 Tax=Sphingomonas nostoxanthinifaciens TaxID=2872652 RepID=UPI001CC1FED0|nr:molybdopterin-dependent oxidoreductase [Sphingomonas nostoxanthinifaciens]